MKLLTADEILKKNDLSTVVFPVPEWGGDVLISELSVKARADFEKRVEDHKGDSLTIYKGVIIWLVLQVLVDEKGNRLCPDKETDSC